jgi:Kef-type K+ transport system membrane component KefB
MTENLQNKVFAQIFVLGAINYLIIVFALISLIWLPIPFNFITAFLMVTLLTVFSFSVLLKIFENPPYYGTLITLRRN